MTIRIQTLFLIYFNKQFLSKILKFILTKNLYFAFFILLFLIKKINLILKLIKINLFLFIIFTFVQSNNFNI